MINTITLHNFKCFRQRSFTVGKLSLFTGLNSAGKSSVLQALLLLRQSYMQQSLPKRGLLLNGPLLSLGTSGAMLNKGADDGHLQHEEKDVCSLTNPHQVANRSAWIGQRIKKDIADGAIAWEKRAEFFPNLIFCDVAAESLRLLTGKEPYFYQICRHLFVLSSFCVAWPKEGISALSGISWSDESNSTLNNQRLRLMREFICPDGERRLFSMHSKPTGGNIRIHFLPIPEQLRIMVGYIGQHLPY